MTLAKRLSRLTIAALLFGATAVSALATEGGGGAYPNGAEDFMAGAAPPPGTYLLNYLNYYSADKFTDGSGHSAVPDFKLRVTADVLRIIHMTDKQVLGATWGMHLFIPVVNVDVTVPGRSETRAGLGDIIVDPCILAWHSKNLHVTTGLDIYLPTGEYDKEHLANPGRHYWTFEPVLGATYLSDSGFELSAKLMYDFNTENTATNYRSGQEFHADWTVGQKLGAATLGVGGYYYQQTSDDEVNGTKIGNRGQSFAVGPQMKYDHQNLSFTLKYQTEISTENRPEGNGVWFKLLYAF